MPIFVSRFENDRGAGLLQSIRGNATNRTADRDNNGPRGLARGQDNASDQAVRGGQGNNASDQAVRRGQDGAHTPTNVRDQLPDQTAAAGELRQRLTASQRPSQPAVRSTDTAAERRASRGDGSPGRLDRAPANPAVQAALDRFESLRNVGRVSEQPAAGERGGGRATATAALRDLAQQIPDIETLQARGLNRGADATIRLAAVQNQTTPQVAEEPAAGRPTADQISRANTTEEIRENLQADSSEIQRGLTADADVQQRQNLRQTARAAAQGSEARRDGQIDSNDRQARELRSVTRELAQDLRAAERSLRDVQNESRRLQTTPNNTASTAANLANRVNILAA
jgi:hypothetical protein